MASFGNMEGCRNFDLVESVGNREVGRNLYRDSKPVF